MPINLHLTPTVPSKHPGIAGAFLILALVSVQPRLSPTLVLQQARKSGNPSLSRRRNKNSDTVLKPGL